MKNGDKETKYFNLIWMYVVDEEKKITYVIGDIHGCYNEYLKLEKLLIKHSKKQKKEPYFLCVGDIFDRGPDSAKLLAHFSDGIKNKTHELLLGNHEAEFIRILHAFKPELFEKNNLHFPSYLRTIESDFSYLPKYKKFETYRDLVYESWLEQGGAETAESFGLDINDPISWEVSLEDVKTLVSLKVIWMNTDVVVTHALPDQVSVDILLSLLEKEGEDLSQKVFEDPEVKEDLQYAVDTCIWNRRLPEETIDENRVHVSGHTPFNEVQSYPAVNMIQIDTGCVYGVKLTAYCPSTEEFFSVESETFWET